MSSLTISLPESVPIHVAHEVHRHVMPSFLAWVKDEGVKPEGIACTDCRLQENGAWVFDVYLADGRHAEFPIPAERLH